jgi:hypothetical protein
MHPILVGEQATAPVPSSAAGSSRDMDDQWGPLDGPDSLAGTLLLHSTPAYDGTHITMDIKLGESP